MTFPPKKKRLKNYVAVITTALKLLEVLKERRKNLDEMNVAMIELERAIDSVI